MYCLWGCRCRRLLSVCFFLNLCPSFYFSLLLSVALCHFSPFSSSFISSLINCSHRLSFRLDFLYVSLIFLSFSPPPLLLRASYYHSSILPPPDRYHPSLHSWLGWLALLSVCFICLLTHAHTDRYTLAVLNDIILYPLGEPGFG